jgi:hypothetical protein
MPRRYEIHPSIGIARVGESSDFFLGPEPLVSSPATRRGADGKIKKQAAGFRVFDCERDDVGRLTNATEVLLPSPTVKSIEWRVHLVNRKGASRMLSDPASFRNNATGDDARDTALIIDPGEKAESTMTALAALAGGSFKGIAVDLGHIEIDAFGHLIVLGGNGAAGYFSPNRQIVHLTNFADNENWYDTMSDGSVRAILTLADRATVETKPSWVVVAPPDFAPDVNNVVSWYDVAFQAAIDRCWLAGAAQPSFKNDIFPILKKLVDYQWVNTNFF